MQFGTWSVFIVIYIGGRGQVLYNIKIFEQCNASLDCAVTINVNNLFDKYLKESILVGEVLNALL